MTASKPRQRAVQQRAEDTKEAILQAAVELFSTMGFDGVSISAIEAASSTKRGLVAYHFGNKDELWKAVADRVFSKLPILSDDASNALRNLDWESQIRAHVTSFVQHSAKHPEISRLIIQEGKSRTWRLEFLVEQYVRPRLKLFADMLGTEIDAHTLYIFIGASTLVFDVEAECEALFGFNPRDPQFVNEHARRICDLIINSGLPARVD